MEKKFYALSLSRIKIIYENSLFLIGEFSFYRADTTP